MGIAAVSMMTVIVGLAGSALAMSEQDQKARGLALYTMGVVYDLQGMTEQAIAEFEKSAELHDHFAVHLRLGADYARIGLLDKSVEELQYVLKFDAGNAQARYLLALVYSTRREFDKAAAEYEAILQSFSEADPENIEIYGYLAQLYYSQKEYQKAADQFSVILSFDPTNTDVIFLLGSLYLDLGERDKAIEMFKRAIKIDPTHDGALNSLGYIYAEDGTNLDEALSFVERALEADPGNGAYLDSLGWIYYKKGNFEKALQYLQEADNNLKDPVIYEHLGDVYFKMKAVDEARKYWDLSLEMQPDQESLRQKIKQIK